MWHTQTTHLASQIADAEHIVADLRGTFCPRFRLTHAELFAIIDVENFAEPANAGNRYPDVAERLSGLNAGERSKH